MFDTLEEAMEGKDDHTDARMVMMNSDVELKVRVTLTLREYAALTRGIVKAQELYGEGRDSLELEHIKTSLAEGSFLQ